MYYGSTLSFFGTALWYQSPAGLLLTVLVFVEYKIALTFEEHVVLPAQPTAVKKWH